MTWRLADLLLRPRRLGVAAHQPALRGGVDQPAEHPECGRALANRTLEALAVLVLAAGRSAATLIPQTRGSLVAEILHLAVPMLVLTLWSQMAHLRTHLHDRPLSAVSRMAATAIAAAPATVARISLVVGVGAVPDGRRPPPFSGSWAASTAPGSCW